MQSNTDGGFSYDSARLKSLASEVLACARDKGATAAEVEVSEGRGQNVTVRHGEVAGTTDRPRQCAALERRVGDEADAEQCQQRRQVEPREADGRRRTLDGATWNLRWNATANAAWPV